MIEKQIKRNPLDNDADMERALVFVREMLSDQCEMKWDDMHLLAGLLGVGKGRRRGRLVTDEEARTIAFMSYFLSATEPKKYPKDTNAIDAVREMHHVSPRTVWTARAKHQVDPQRIRDVASAIDDPAAERNLLQRIDGIIFLLTGNRP
jgi:hypothetical protein